MFPSIVRNVLPVVTSVVATLFLATAVPHGLVPEAAAAGLAAESVASVDDADGTSLAERTEWQARDDAAARRASRQ